jgi:hypothetical protein
MKQPDLKMYDGHLTTRVEYGSELCAMHLRNTHKPKTPVALIGFGNTPQMAALHVITQLRLYADWIAHDHGLPVIDIETLRTQHVMRTGRALVELVGVPADWNPSGPPEATRLTIKHDSAASPAANRFDLGPDEERIIRPGEQTMITITRSGGYDPRLGSAHPDNQDPTLPPKSPK